LKLVIVSSRIAKAQLSIWATADNVGIVVVLAIIMPETNLTDLVAAAFTERLEATAGTS
jgi:hypothetical protein